MALLFVDSFDHVGTLLAGLAAKWDLISGTPLISSTTVRTGTGALQLGVTADITKQITPPGDVFILGWGFRMAGISTTTEIVRFLESSTVHLALIFDASGFLVVKRGSTVLATATSHAFLLNTWYYIEVKVVVHDTTGSVAVRVDGVPVTFNASLTGIDTRNAGTAGIVDRVRFAGSAAYYFYDDLYICDDAGSVNNDFLGICKIERLLPSTGNGDHVDFTCSTGTDHGALVDENPPTDDTDYVSSDTAGHQDCYHYPSLALTGSILGVQTNLYARKTDAGARTVAAIVRSGGTTYPGAALAPLTTYRYLTEVQAVNPATGLAWTAAEIAGLQVGMKILS